MVRSKDDIYSIKNMASEGELFDFYTPPKNPFFNPFDKPKVDRYAEFKKVCADLKRIIEKEKLTENK